MVGIDAKTPGLIRAASPTLALAALMGLLGFAALGRPFPQPCSQLEGGGAEARSCRTVVVFGDTQDLTDHRAPHADWLGAMVDWVIANRDKEHIDFVLHVGDITEHGWMLPTSPFCRKDCTFDGGPGLTPCACPQEVEKEWRLFTRQFQRLEEARIPFAIVPGNHDNSKNRGGRWDGPGFSDYYSPSHLAELPGYLESRTSVASGCTATAWQFSLGPAPVIVLGIPDSGEDLRTTSTFAASRMCSEDDPEIENWARQLIARPEHLAKPVILLHHQLFDFDEKTGAWLPRNKWIRIVREGSPERFLAAVHGHFQGASSAKYRFVTEKDSRTGGDVEIFVPRVDWQDTPLDGRAPGIPSAASSLAIMRFSIRGDRPDQVEVRAWSEFFKSDRGAGAREHEGMPRHPIWHRGR